MKDRIKLIMEQQGCSQVDFARKIGIAPASLSGIFTGRTQPTLATATAIHKHFPFINLSWLLFGEGDMMPSSAQDAATLSGADVVSTSAPVAPSAVASPGAMSVGDNMPLQSTNSRVCPVDVDAMKNFDKKERKISEIRVFFDDGTYEVYQTFKS